MLRQFIKFSLVGVLNTAIHYGVFYVLYRFGGFYYLLASGMAFGVALTHSYILNKIWTFKQRESRGHREFSKFFLVNILSLAANLATLAILVESLAVHPPIAQLLAYGISWAMNFLGNRFWTFRILPD